MASRENNGLHAALIIFVMITVVLVIATYMNYRAAEEAENKRIAAVQQLKVVTDNGTQRGEEVAILKYTLGWETNETKDGIEGRLKGVAAGEIQKIYEAYKQDMFKWGEGIENPNYRNVSDALAKAIQDKGELITTDRNAAEKWKLKLDETVKRTQDEIEKHLEARRKAEEDLKTERAKFENDRNTLKLALKNNEDTRDKLKNDMNALDAKHLKRIKELENAIAKGEELVSEQKAEIDAHTKAENFEVADGKITFVNLRDNTVLINLGSADGMRPQVIFSVYDRSESSATKSKKKGGIEVVKIVDQHTSEARIVQDSSADPILPGDQIYSPVWHRGPKLHFALTGWIDFDGDGENDRATLQHLIEMNNGVIDAVQEDNGKVKGKMTFQTRYLIDVKELPERAADNIRVGRSEMIMQAKNLGVKKLFYKELLDYMGWPGAEKTVVLGAGGSVTEGKKTDGSFRPRTPKEAGADGAF